MTPESKSLPHSHTKTLVCIVYMRKVGVYTWRLITHFVTNKHGMKVGSTHVLIRWKWPRSCFFVATLNKNSLICLKMGLLSCCFMAKFPTQNGGGKKGGGGLFHFKKLRSKWNKYWTFNLEIGRTGLKPAQLQIFKTSSLMNILGSLSFFGSYWFPPIKSMDKIQYPPIRFSPLVRPLVRSFWTEEYTTHFLLPRTILFMWFFFFGGGSPQYPKSHPIYFTHRFYFLQIFGMKMDFIGASTF